MISRTHKVTLWSTRDLGAAQKGLIAFSGTLLLWLSAKIQVPFWPVPMTMQTLAVLLIGAALGAKLATATVVLYLFEGAVGLPVFAGTPEKGLGIAYLIGPTGGYLIGFVACAFFVGHMADRGLDRTVPGMLLAAAIGHAVIFLLGWAWLATSMGAAPAFTVGVAPFWAATILKTALAALLLPAIWRLRRS